MSQHKFTISPLDITILVSCLSLVFAVAAFTSLKQRRKERENDDPAAAEGILLK
jgi:hypothetical protein